MPRQLALFFFFCPVVSTLAAACAPDRCGDLAIRPPFGLVSGATENQCVQFGFQTHCTADIPYLGYYDNPWRRRENNYDLRILHIFYANASLLVSDVHKLADLNRSSAHCHAPTANTSSKIGRPFSISPLNRNLLFYSCAEAPARKVREQAGLIETVCRNNTFVRAAGRFDGTGDYAIEGCRGTAVTVRGPPTGELNAGDYLQLISDGFLLTWQPPPAAAAGSTSGKLAHSSK